MASRCETAAAAARKEDVYSWIFLWLVHSLVFRTSPGEKVSMGVPALTHCVRERVRQDPGESQKKTEATYFWLKAGVSVFGKEAEREKYQKHIAHGTLLFVSSTSTAAATAAS